VNRVADFMTTLPPTDLRYERKFLPAGRSVAEVVALVRQHPALFREAYPERPVNNLYFDTPGLRHYFDHVNGSACREKVRLRWYGEFHGHVERPRLEFKHRQGLLGGKTTHRLPPFAVNGGFDRDALTALWTRAELPEATRLHLRGVQPVLANRYRRSYFASTDGHFRLTLDWALETYDARAAAHAPHAVRQDEPRLILELKYDAAHAAEADRVANSFPFRLTRCSKYVLGLERLAL
jgi:hypothetical protein